MMRKNIFKLLLCLPLLTGCFYDRMFELEWDEEVKLHDGQIIIVHRKTNYERLSQGLMPYDGKIIPRATTISFPEDPSNPISSKKITQNVKNGSFHILDRYKNKWFIKLRASSLGPPASGDRYYDPKELFGPRQNSDDYGGILIDDKFIPIPLCDMPKNLYTGNFLWLDYSIAGLSDLKHQQFANTRVDLKTKNKWHQSIFYERLERERIDPEPLAIPYFCESENLNINWKKWSQYYE